MVKVLSNGELNMAFIDTLRRVNPLSHYYITDLINAIYKDDRQFSVEIDCEYNITGYWLDK